MTDGTTNFCPHVPPGEPPCAACRGDNTEGAGGMSNYSALSAHELDKLVAERLGWRNLETVRQFDGLKWLDMWWTGVHTDGEADNVPRYSTDANAALKLDETLPQEAYINLDSGSGWMARIHDFSGDTTEDYYGYADTPARAIVLAWLAWKGA